MKALAAVAALLFCTSTHADNWIPTANSDSADFSILKGSFIVSKNKAGEEVATVTGRIRGTATKTVVLEKWYVKTADCAQKQGKIVTVDMDGKFKYENDFVFEAGSIASVNAELICIVYKASQGKSM